MLFDEPNISSVKQLVEETKSYLELQKQYVRLELTEKLTILLSTMVLVLLLVILGMVALFYLSFALAYVLEPLVGGLMGSFAIITLFLLLIMIAIYMMRKQIIINPIVRFLAKLFLQEDSFNQTPKNNEESTNLQ